MSLRRLRTLTKELPLDGALGRARKALPSQDWQHAEELLATIAELIDDNTRTLLRVNVKKGTQLPKPLRIPRPWKLKKKRRKATSDDLKRLFGVAGTYVPTDGSSERAE